MTAQPRVFADLTSFVAAVAGRASPTCSLYGIPLLNSRGERAAYVGRTEEGERPDAFLEALRAPKGDGAPRQPAASGRLPSLLHALWQKGFYYETGQMCLLQRLQESAHGQSATGRAWLLLTCKMFKGKNAI